MEAEDFQTLNHNLLKKIDKIIRYENHVINMSVYRKLRIIPKGFLLKFHTNIPDFNVTDILKKCSLKLMEKLITHYKHCL